MAESIRGIEELLAEQRSFPDKLRSKGDRTAEQTGGGVPRTAHVVSSDKSCRKMEIFDRKIID